MHAHIFFILSPVHGQDCPPFRSFLYLYDVTIKIYFISTLFFPTKMCTINWLHIARALFVNGSPRSCMFLALNCTFPPSRILGGVYGTLKTSSIATIHRGFPHKHMHFPVGSALLRVCAAPRPRRTVENGVTCHCHDATRPRPHLIDSRKSRPLMAHNNSWTAYREEI